MNEQTHCAVCGRGFGDLNYWHGCVDNGAFCEDCRKKWTENALFIMLKTNPDLIKGWVTFRRDVEKTSKEMVQFT